VTAPDGGGRPARTLDRPDVVGGRGAVAAAGGTADEAGVARADAGTWADVWVTPLIVVVGLGAVFAWVAGRQLDSIEARALEPAGILSDLGRHLLLTALSTVAVIVIAVPLGILLSRRRARKVRGAVLAVGGFAQALPPYGVLVLIAFLPPPFGFNVFTAVVGLVAAALLPVLRNTVVGLAQVDSALVEAARGMGMSARTTLWRVELPLAVPVMVAGIRVALVLNVGTAALATFVGGGGLGSLIVRAQTLNRPVVLVTAGAIVAALALLVDWLAGLAERAVARRTGGGTG
jgi:osmoprotectant transport system permease protein